MFRACIYLAHLTQTACVSSKPPHSAVELGDIDKISFLCLSLSLYENKLIFS